MPSKRKSFAKWVAWNLNHNLYEMIDVFPNRIRIAYLYQDAFKQINRKGHPGYNRRVPNSKMEIPIDLLPPAAYKEITRKGR